MIRININVFIYIKKLADKFTCKYLILSHFPCYISSKLEGWKIKKASNTRLFSKRIRIRNPTNEELRICFACSSMVGDITAQTCHVPGDVRRVERKLEERLFTCSVITLGAVHSRRTCIHSETSDTHSIGHGRISTSS